MYHNSLNGKSRIKRLFLAGLVAACVCSLGITDSAEAAPSTSRTLEALFKNPPDGYGPVPFYWWVGEKLTKERLLWQLEELDKAGTQGLCVSYPHSHPLSDPEFNRNGHGDFGMTYPSDPLFFSEQWWELWNWFTGECAKRNMGVGLDDYTFVSPGNKRWPDEIAALPEMKNYRGKLFFSKPIAVKGEENINVRIPDGTISLTAFVTPGENIADEQPVNLLKLASGKNSVSWTAQKGGDWQIVGVETRNNFMLHPQHGKEVIKRYYQKFEDHVDPQNRKGLNYFFQDELHVDLGADTWAEDFAEEFQKYKGYDIRPLLAALRYDIGPRTPKIRLDYMDVVSFLAEDRYFRPIFEWHWKRGMVFGCDNWGRGKNPVAYADYFRATRWFTAPGNDAPRGGTALIQTKVSSSIAHLYNRPRVWLEAFHSMGWQASPQLFTEATDRHFLLGGNLLCLHGLYYTTYGGWWEWAPPDFHFRMPYWPHMKDWLKSIERKSYLLSQGHHVCDVAVVYPTSPMHADPGIKSPSFSTAVSLYSSGIDFDFIDYQSLARATVKDGQLHIAGERYRVLVMEDMKAVRFSSLKKAQELFRSGGVVIGTGALPSASDRVGADDPEIDAIEKEVFGLTAAQALVGQTAQAQHNAAGGKGIYTPNGKNNIGKLIKEAIICDFSPSKSIGHVQHRRIGNRDVYMVMDVPKGTECFFRSHGKVELWDAMTGQTEELQVVRKTEEGTVLRIPVAPPKSCFVVFSPGNPQIEQTVSGSIDRNKTQTMDLNGKWESEIAPTMDNRWGDFRLPATKKLLGPEARQMRYSPEQDAGAGWQAAEFNDGAWRQVTCDFGPGMWYLNIPANRNIDSIVDAVVGKSDFSGKVKLGQKKYSWTPYEFSWRWGVENQPGSQGYHGLKGKISDHFLIMGKGGHHFFTSFIHVPRDMTVRVLQEGREPYGIWIDSKKLMGKTLRLATGRHRIMVCYKNIKAEPGPRGNHPIDKRARSAVVLVEDRTEQRERLPLSMKWYGQPGILRYDCYSSKAEVGCYRFKAPPGLKGLSFAAYGDVSVWVDGDEAELKRGGKRDDGAIQYTVTLASPVPGLSNVALRVEHDPGYYGGAAFPQEIALVCGKGIITAGDWSEIGVLKHYSGGMWYRRNISLKSGQITGRTILDLGKVGSTCELHVNGNKAGILITAPYTMDISKYVKVGENRLEILVYNTLANHYQTIPTPDAYKRPTASGLLGPVTVRTVMHLPSSGSTLLPTATSCVMESDL
jgi:hypothetical protein